MLNMYIYATVCALPGSDEGWIQRNVIDEALKMRTVHASFENPEGFVLGTSPCTGSIIGAIRSTYRTAVGLRRRIGIRIRVQKATAIHVA